MSQLPAAPQDCWFSAAGHCWAISPAAEWKSLLISKEI
jgi:hypothetical protein